MFVCCVCCVSAGVLLAANVCLIVCGLEPSTIRQPRCEFGCCTTEKIGTSFFRDREMCV